MKIHALWVAIVALAGCAAPVARTGPDEWAIAGSGTDALRMDSTIRARHARQAAQICGEARMEQFEPTQPDAQYHFRCISPVHSRADEVRAARSAWLDCLETAEPTVDDMLSDGHTVAAVLATRCEAEVQALLATVGKGFRSWSMPEDALQRVRRQVALDVVLQMRAQKRSPDARVPPVEIPPIGPGG